VRPQILAPPRIDGARFDAKSTTNLVKHVHKQERLLDPALYDAIQGPDDAPGEYEGVGFTRTFPKRLDGGRPEIGKDYYEAFDHTPWNNELVADLARAVITQERLGEAVEMAVELEDFAAPGGMPRDADRHQQPVDIAVRGRVIALAQADRHPGRVEIDPQDQHQHPGADAGQQDRRLRQGHMEFVVMAPEGGQQQRDAACLDRVEPAQRGTVDAGAREHVAQHDEEAEAAERQAAYPGDTAQEGVIGRRSGRCQGRRLRL